MERATYHGVGAAESEHNLTYRFSNAVAIFDALHAVVGLRLPKRGIEVYRRKVSPSGWKCRHANQKST